MEDDEDMEEEDVEEDLPVPKKAKKELTMQDIYGDENDDDYGDEESEQEADQV